MFKNANIIFLIVLLLFKIVYLTLRSKIIIDMSASLKFVQNEKLYLKDPDQSELGRKILPESIKLIDDIGFEKFTFKKLSKCIDSTETSVYRYFENKYKLLVYIISCYWLWLDYQIEYHTNNINEPKDKLKIVIKLLTDLGLENINFTKLNTAALQRIVSCESAKVFMIKEIKKEDKEVLYLDIQAVCEKICNIVRQINPEHPYPKALVTTLFEAAHQQTFFARNMSGITELKVKNNDVNQVIQFLEHLAFSSLYQSSTLRNNE